MQQISAFGVIHISKGMPLRPDKAMSPTQAKRAFKRLRVRTAQSGKPFAQRLKDSAAFDAMR